MGLGARKTSIHGAFITGDNSLRNPQGFLTVSGETNCKYTATVTDFFRLVSPF